MIHTLLEQAAIASVALAIAFAAPVAAIGLFLIYDRIVEATETEE